MTSKTKLFCKTSSVFQVDNIKNEGNSARLPSNMESWVQSSRPRANAFSDFCTSTCLKYWACHEKVMRSHTKCCTCHATSSQQTWKIWCSKMQPISGNQRPDFRTALMNMSLALRLPRVRHLVDPLRMSHACHRFRKCYKTLTFCSLLTRCIIPCACHTKTGIWTSKSAPNPSVFYTFDFDVCFAPQRRVLLRHLNFQKMCVAGTTACTFFDIATSKSGAKLRCFVHFDLKCALRHNSVHFFDITTSKSEDQKWSEVVLSCTFWLWNAHPPL